MEVICNQILNNFIRIINAIETLKRQIDLVGNKDRWHIAVFISKPEGLCFVDMKTMETKKKWKQFGTEVRNREIEKF